MLIYDERQTRKIELASLGFSRVPVMPRSYFNINVSIGAYAAYSTSCKSIADTLIASFIMFLFSPSHLLQYH